MTRDETKTVLGMLQVNYPHHYKNLSGSEKSMLVDTWTAMFGEIPFSIMKQATVNLMRYESFPSPDAMQRQIDEIMRPENDTELWGKLLKAIRKSTYHSKEAFEELPEICQKFVSNPSALKELASLPPDKVNTVVESNFLKQASAIRRHEEVQLGLPMEVKNLIAQAKQNQLTYMEE